VKKIVLVKTTNSNFALLQMYRCETEGLQEIKPGTMSSDAECGNSTSVDVFYSIFKWLHTISETVP